MTTGFHLEKIGERPENPALALLVEGDALKPIRVPSDDIRVELQHFDQDIQFFNAHHREILRLYPDRWVAVYDEQVVGADEDLRRLLKGLKALGYPPGSSLIRLMETNPMILRV